MRVPSRFGSLSCLTRPPRGYSTQSAGGGQAHWGPLRLMDSIARSSEGPSSFGSSPGTGSFASGRAAGTAACQRTTVQQQASATASARPIETDPAHRGHPFISDHANHLPHQPSRPRRPCCCRVHRAAQAGNSRRYPPRLRRGADPPRGPECPAMAFSSATSPSASAHASSLNGTLKRLRWHQSIATPSRSDRRLSGSVAFTRSTMSRNPAKSKGHVARISVGL
jgi:hypothetical protein